LKIDEKYCGGHIMRNIKRLVIINLLIILNSVFCLSEVHKYVPKVLHTIPDGNNNNQVNIFRDYEIGDQYGPMLYVTPDGEIYLADVVNGRIKKFDSNGNLVSISTETIDSVSQFVVDGNKNIYIQDGSGKLIKLNENGIIISESDEYTYESIPGKKKLEKTPTSLYLEFKKMERFRRLGDENDYSIGHDKHGRNYKMIPVGEKQKNRKLEIIAPNQQVVKTVIFPKLDNLPKVPKYGMLGDWVVDEDGNLYVDGAIDRAEIIVIRKDFGVGGKQDYKIFSDIIVLKYNNKGELLTYVQFPGTGFIRSENVHIDKKGNIYCLELHVNDLSVMKYELQQTSEKNTREQTGTSYLAKYTDLQNKTLEELKLLRNEIYARHGYIFKSKELFEYFRKQDWYKPDPNFTETMFSEEEKEMIKKLRELENQKQ
jgi:hypothetical protein